MKAVILAGGLGTRISEETNLRPEPMVEIGGKPVLWNILKIYSAHGINEFVICYGYKGFVIKEYFAKVTLVDTGEATMPGGCLKRVRDYVCDYTFCFTYGDGVADVDVSAFDCPSPCS